MTLIAKISGDKVHIGRACGGWMTVSVLTAGLVASAACRAGRRVVVEAVAREGQR